MFNRSKKPPQPAQLNTPPEATTTGLSDGSAADAIAPRPLNGGNAPANGSSGLSAAIEERRQTMVSSGDVGPTVIQRDMVLKGMILTDGAVELHGVIEGDICAKTFSLGETGQMSGDVVAEQVQLSGEGQGRVTARRVRLDAGARYKGDILHQRLSIEDGAEFEGAVLRKTDETAWTEITKTFETPGVELTDDAMQAVEALKAEFEKRARR
ncbi:MAG: polymer-forming cytoskeletal protein [Pseudomonadota bacterium]